MKSSTLFRVVAATIFAVAIPLAAQAQEITLQGVLSGKNFPTTMKPADLPDSYMAVKIATGEAGGLMDMITGPMMMVGGMMGGMMGKSDKEGKALGEIMEALELSWTDGQIVNLAGQAFVVTYKAGLGMGDMMGMGDSPNFSAIPLRLTLLRADSIKGLTPRPDMTKSELVRRFSAKLPSKTPGPKVETGVAEIERHECRQNLQMIANAVQAAKVTKGLRNYSTLFGAVSIALEPDLSSVPKCPLGGHYTVEKGADGTSTTYRIRCSVALHGTFEPGIDAS